MNVNVVDSRTGIVTNEALGFSPRQMVRILGKVTA